MLGEAAGYFYDDLFPHSHLLQVADLAVRTIDLDKLIELKRFAGRAKDNEMVAELEVIRQDKLGSAKRERPDHR